MIVILGANGQVGSALQALLGPQCVALSREQADLIRLETLPAVLQKYSPSVIINAAAYTAVDKAEKERETAFAVNGAAPGLLAAWCAEKDIPFVHYSTDYVFNGTGHTPHREGDTPNPVNLYGASKLAGERAIEKAGGKYLILRTSWVYDAHGKNFLNTMLRLGAEREEVKVVNDQFGAPTYAPQLAAATLEALKRANAQPQFPSGIYHLTHGGETNWHGFAEAIFTTARAKGAPLAVQRITAIPSESFPTPAARPKNSRLANEKIARVLGVSLPAWQEGLAACMNTKYENPSHSA